MGQRIQAIEFQNLFLHPVWYDYILLGMHTFCITEVTSSTISYFLSLLFLIAHIHVTSLPLSQMFQTINNNTKVIQYYTIM